MRRIGIGLVSILVVLGVVFGAIAGAIVGAVTVAANTGNSSSPHVSLTAANDKQASVSKVVPITSATSVVKRVGPAVVTIQHTLPTTYDMFGQPQSGGTALGSGYIVDTKGDIVTNAHVVSGASHFTVIFASGKRTPATLVGANTEDDIAVVHVNGPVPAIAHFGDSSKVQPGEPVIAIGNALGQFQNTVTEGIVSGLHRSLSGLTSQDMIQTDAAINHGNSGGPLLDLEGNVIGMNTAIDRSTNEGSGSVFGQSDPNATVAEGLGFAIPSNTVAAIAEHLINHVPGGYLGVFYSTVRPVALHYGVPQGAAVTRVVKGSPAAEAGIRVHDIILSLAGKRVSSTQPLENIMALHKAGDHVRVKLWRASHILTLNITLGTQPSTK